MVDVIPVHSSCAVVIHVHKLVGQDGCDRIQVLALVGADDHLVICHVVPKHLHCHVTNHIKTIPTLQQAPLHKVHIQHDVVKKTRIQPAPSLILISSQKEKKGPE